MSVPFAPVNRIAAAATTALFIAAALLAAAPVQAQTALGVAPDPVSALSPEQEKRYQKFTHELRCLVCQNQTIAESQAPLAQDLRVKVSEQIAAGRSDAEVVDWLTARYGDYVLYRPPLKASTLLLWAGPFALVLLGLVFAWRYSRRSLAAARAQGAALAGGASDRGGAATGSAPPTSAATAQDAAVQRLLAEHHDALAATPGDARASLSSDPSPR